MRVDASVELPVPRERVWEILTRWEDQARWMKDADRVEVLSPHREGVGVRLAVRTRVFDVPVFTDRLEVTLWRPPERLEITHRRLIKGRGIWTLEGSGPATRFTWVEDVSLPVPVLGELALLVYRPFLRRLMRAGLEGLRRSALAR